MIGLRVLVESGSKRVFACALDWPGLARSGKTEAAAIEALLVALRRYAVVALEAGLAFEADPTAGVEAVDVVDVVERVTGTATTDFGAPGIVGEADRAPVSSAEAERLASLVAASWAVFARVVAAAPEALRKGPRGGGRDRSAIAGHVGDSERAYAGVMGIRDGGRPLDEVRREILALLTRPSDGSPLAGRRWPPRYAARRIAWHALDHAWEIQDRSEPA